jgi:hypothetical protein
LRRQGKEILRDLKNQNSEYQKALLAFCWSTPLHPTRSWAYFLFLQIKKYAHDLVAPQAL